MDLPSITAPWHAGLEYCNGVYDWLHTDNEANFLRMMQDQAHREYFQRQGWTVPGAIQYRINSLGFRGAEFVNGGILALGCSFTFGSGLPEQVLWPNLVAQHLNTHANNLSWPGSAADTVFRLAEYWIPTLKPILVCVLTPPRSRIEVLTDHPAAEVYMPSNQIPGTGHDAFLKNWFLIDENAKLNQRKNCLAITALCNKYQIACIIKHADQEMSRSREELEYARDYMHAGPRGHRLLAEKILNEY